MTVQFNNFKDWSVHCAEQNVPLYQPVLEYEMEQKGRTEEEIWDGLSRAYKVMKDAVITGLEEDMSSRSGMIENGGKKVFRSEITVLSPEFQKLALP